MKRWSMKAGSLMTAIAMTATLLGSGQTMIVDAEESQTKDATEKVQLTDEDIKALTVEKDDSFTRNSVHDPSVVDGKNGYYYVFGSHMGVSKTNDFMNWESVTGESATSTLFGAPDANGVVQAVSFQQALRNNQSNKVTILVDGVPTEVDFGNYDASAWNTARDDFSVQGNMWAPDVVYNDTLGKWCMYLSLNGSTWNSVIILLTADEVEGPYVYQGPVVSMC